MAKEHKLQFERGKTTENTVVFKEVPPKGEPPMVRTLYVQKWAAQDHKTLTLTITFGG